MAANSPCRPIDGSLTAPVGGACGARRRGLTPEGCSLSPPGDLAVASRVESARGKKKSRRNRCDGPSPGARLSKPNDMSVATWCLVRADAPVHTVSGRCPPFRRRHRRFLESAPGSYWRGCGSGRRQGSSRKSRNAWPCWLSSFQLHQRTRRVRPETPKYNKRLGFLARRNRISAARVQGPQRDADDARPTAWW